jgi:SRSO17 transposase
LEVLMMTTRADVRRWAGEFEALTTRLAPRFGRREPRQRAVAYLHGLLSPIQRKNGWQLAEAAGDRTPDGVQDFLARMRWDADLVRDDLRAYVVQHLGDEQAVLVLDETGFLKKGVKSAGVHRQYSGTAGRIENCQIGVFLGYASCHGQALIDRALYLPKCWSDDPERCRQAGVPDDIGFATKPEIARTMLERTFAAGVACAWVTGDSLYGSDHRLRRTIEDAGKGYVLQVTSNQHLGFVRVDEWLDDVPADGWVRLSAGEGAKGPRLYDWAYLPHNGARDGWQMALLMRAKIDQPDDLAFFLTLAPAGTPLETLVRIAGMRWRIEACFEAAKGEVGLNQYEVRNWTGWHRHITLAMLAHAYLGVVRRRAIRGRGRERSGGRALALDGARDTTAAVGAGVGQRPRPGGYPLVVRLAQGAPATRQAMSLETQNQ